MPSFISIFFIAHPGKYYRLQNCQERMASDRYDFFPFLDSLSNTEVRVETSLADSI